MKYAVALVTALSMVTVYVFTNTLHTQAENIDW